MNGKVKKINQVSKTNSSMGNWAVNVSVEYTATNGYVYQTDTTLFFWSKNQEFVEGEIAKLWDTMSMKDAVKLFSKLHPNVSAYMINLAVEQVVKWADIGNYDFSLDI